VIGRCREAQKRERAFGVGNMSGARVCGLSRSREPCGPPSPSSAGTAASRRSNSACSALASKATLILLHDLMPRALASASRTGRGSLAPCRLVYSCSGLSLGSRDSTVIFSEELSTH